MESSFELEVENVKCVGTCSMIVLGGMVSVVRSPSPPPMIGSPAATLMSFRLRVDLIDVHISSRPLILYDIILYE